MASTYTTNLGIEKIGTGEQSGTWGETTNLNFDILDQAINGLVSVTLPAAGSTGSPNTLPITDGAVSDGRNAFIELVDGGDLGGTAYVQLTPNDAEKIVYVRNSLSNSRAVILFQGTYNASNDFELANGKDALLYFNGGGSGAVVGVVQANEVRSGSFQIDNIVLDGNTIDVDGDLNIDVSDSDILLKDDGTTFGGFSLGGTDTDNLVIKSGSTPTAALTLHEGNVGFGTQDEASYLIDAQSASAGIQARFISTDASASSGPDLKFYKNSASPADGDVISTFYFNANTDDGAGGVSLSDVNYGSIVFNAVETNETNGEAAGFALNLKRGGTIQQYISIVGGTTSDTDDDSITLSTGGTAAMVIDNSQNVAFDTDTLYVDATNDRVGVGTDSPGFPLDVVCDSSAQSIRLRGRSADNLSNITLTSNDAATIYGNIFAFNNQIGIEASQASGIVVLRSGGTTERMRLSTTEAVVNEGSNDYDFRVESENISNLFGIDAAEDAITIKTSSPSDATLTVQGSSTGNYNAIQIRNSATPNLNKGGYISFGRYDDGDASWVGVAGFDNGSDRIVYVGGGAWGIEEATITRLYAANAYGDASAVLRLQCSASETVINDPSADHDFRVESDGNANMLFVDAANDAVGIGTNAPTGKDASAKLQINSTAEATPASGLVLAGAYGASNRFHGIGFAIAGGAVSSGIYTSERGTSKSHLYFYTASDYSSPTLVENMVMNPDGVFINDSGADRDFRVESDGNTNMLFVDAGNDRVGLGTGSPSYPMDVQGTSGASTVILNVQGSTTSGDAETVLRISQPGDIIGSNSEIRSGVTSGQNPYLAFAVRESVSPFATVERMRLGTNGSLITKPSTGGHAVFNEDSNDADFLVESNNNANLFKVDAGQDRVFINGFYGPYCLVNGFQVTNTGQSTYASSQTEGILAVSTYNNTAVSGQHSSLNFRVTSNASTHNSEAQIGLVQPTTNSHASYITTVVRRGDGNRWEPMRLDSEAGAIFNEGGASYADFRVESDNNSHALWVDAGNDRVQVAGRFVVDESSATITNYRTYQIVNGQATAAASNTYLDVVDVGVTSALNVKVIAVEATSQVGVWVGSVASAYGGNTSTAQTESYVGGNITEIAVRYDNTASTIQIRVIYTGSTPTIYWTIDGMTNQAMYNLA